MSENVTPPHDGVFITCAVTGSGHTAHRSDLVPVTPEQIATDCMTGLPARDVSLYAEVVERVRSSDVDVVLNLTTGMGGDITLGPVEQPLPPADEGTDMVGATERLEHIGLLRPEICTLDCGTMNFGEGDYVMTNTPNTLEAMAGQIRDFGVRPEIEVFDTGHLAHTRALAKRGFIDEPVMVQLCMGVPWGAPDDLNTFMAMRHNVPDGWTFSAFALGANQLKYVSLAALAGGNVRVGLEDNLYLERGIMASNRSLVERAVSILEAQNYTILGPSHVRDNLQLTKYH